MDSLTLENGATSDAPTGARHSKADSLWNRAPVGGRTEVLPVEFENGRIIGSAEARRTLDDNIKHGLELGWRGADNPQNLSCSRLLLQRLSRFIEHPRIFDCDHSLVGEGLEQRDLLVGKRINFGTSKLNRSDRYPLAQHWNAKDRSVT